jgi:ferredoxin-NADP reductase
VTDVINHGERVYSVFLKPESLVPRFLPGQFLHLALDPYHPGDFWPESRVFSIASASTERSLLRITYAVKGKFTTRMESDLQAGREVWVKLPYGEFTVNPESDVCFLAGGTGITAFTSFLAELPLDYPHNVYLFYGARKPDLLIYRSVVETALERCPNFHAFFIVEQVGKMKNCLEGRLDIELVWNSVPNPLSATFYLAGPPSMLQVLRKGLWQHGVGDAKVKIDAWE